MKIFHLFILLSIFSEPSFAQWELHDCGATTPKMGVLQMVAVTENVAWGSLFDVTGINNTTHQFTTTGDGGSDWISGDVGGVPSNYSWACLAAVGADTAYALFNNDTLATGVIYRTYDGGSSWSALNAFSTQSSPRVVYFFSGTQGIVVCDPVNGNFKIYSTNDGGNSWDSVPANSIPTAVTGEHAINASFDARGGKFFFGTDKGRLYDTANKGQAWDANQIPGLSARIDKVLLIDSKSILLRQYDPSTGEYSFKRTLDGGTSWDNLNPNGPFYSQNLCRIPNTDHTLVSVGWDANVAVGSSYSNTGGEGWIPIDTGVAHTAAAFFDNAHGWSGGVVADDMTGGVFKFTGYFFATGINEPESNGPTFSLSPNPTTDHFIFKSSSAMNHEVELRITDVSGKLILSEDWTASSTQEISVDVSNWSEGIYFVQLSNDAGVSAEKIVVTH